MTFVGYMTFVGHIMSYGHVTNEIVTEVTICFLPHSKRSLLSLINK